MWLFDDLLKKPTPPSVSDSSGATQSGSQGSGNPPIDPLAEAIQPVIKIEKTNEVSIMTESAANTATSEPAPVKAIAVDDVSSILINSESPAAPSIVISEEPSNVTPIITTQNEDLFGGISHVEVNEATPTITKTPEVTDLGNLFGWMSTEEIQAPVESVVTTEETLSDVPETITVSEAPIAEDVVIAEETPSEKEVEEAVQAEAEEEVEEVTTTLAEEPTEEASILGYSSDSIMDLWEAAEAPQIEESYEHPADFIQASIEKIDRMIEKIDMAHGTKLEEALGYKTEKEKYTTLEEQAYADAEKYVTEKEHALTMRTYFVDQGKMEEHGDLVVQSETPATPIASVETTLTGLAVQSAVTETVTPSKKTKKAEAEEVWLLGL